MFIADYENIRDVLRGYCWSRDYYALVRQRDGAMLAHHQTFANLRKMAAVFKTLGVNCFGTSRNGTATRFKQDETFTKFRERSNAEKRAWLARKRQAGAALTQ